MGDAVGDMCFLQLVITVILLVCQNVYHRLGLPLLTLGGRWNVGVSENGGYSGGCDAFRNYMVDSVCYRD